MGASSSRPEKSEVLSLCKERNKYIKQTIDSRYALSAVHISYFQSLRSIGVALGQLAEAGIKPESPVSSISSLSDDDLEVDSPLHDISNPNSHHLTPGISYMRSGRNTGVKVRLHPSVNGFVDEDESVELPPSPPLLPDELCSSWDYFEPAGEGEMPTGLEWCDTNKSERLEDAQQVLDEEAETLATSSNAASENVCLAVEKIRQQKNDAGPFKLTTENGKDFLLSVKDIEHRFFRASESGKEVSRMFESDKIRLNYIQNKGKSSKSLPRGAFHLVCCCWHPLVTDEQPQLANKVITWNRTISSQSSSSKNVHAFGSKDNGDDSGSDFIEEFSMITGSHSSTLDRLYAWEKKLYDEVKASEVIRKAYEHQLDHLKHQFSVDASAEVINKTRVVVKDHHSQIRVALYAVDSIAKRIERMRDEELQPQLVELLQGLTRMWKNLLECHQRQSVIMSVAVIGKSSAVLGESFLQVLIDVQQEIEYFGSSFADWISAQKNYVDAINAWLQNCIKLPPRFKGKQVFSPRRALAPSIFVLFHDWSTEMKNLPLVEIFDAIKAFASDIQNSVLHIRQEQQQRQLSSQLNNNGENSHIKVENEESKICLDLSSMHKKLTKVVNALTKYAEASVMMYEGIQQGTEAAEVAYTNCRKT